MSHPWMKFYPSDWRADPSLRMCSIAARGLWMDMLCIMHEAAPRGFMLINGSQVTERQMASLCGVSLRECSLLIIELETAGVFSRGDNGEIFSRRMVRDEEKAERDKANGKAGGNPTLKPGVNPPHKAHAGAQSIPRDRDPEARSQIPEERKKEPLASLARCIDLDFEILRKAYPTRGGRDPRKPARLAYEAAVKRADPAMILDAASAFATALTAAGKIGSPYIPQLQNWLKQDSWNDEYKQEVTHGRTGRPPLSNTAKQIYSELFGGGSAASDITIGPQAGGTIIQLLPSGGHGGRSNFHNGGVIDAGAIRGPSDHAGDRPAQGDTEDLSISPIHRRSS